jgi:hypothetical protein
VLAARFLGQFDDEFFQLGISGKKRLVHLKQGEEDRETNASQEVTKGGTYSQKIKSTTQQTATEHWQNTKILQEH